MLKAPLIGRCPTYLPIAARCPSLLCGSLDPPLSKVASAVVSALDREIPGPHASEVVWSGYWDAFLLNMFQVAGRARGLSIRVARNVVDSTLTADSARRDFYLFLQDRVIVHGEDKSELGGLPAAIEDLESKHKGSSPYVYGGLKFCIGFATGVVSLSPAKGCIWYDWLGHACRSNSKTVPHAQVGVRSSSSLALSMRIAL